MKVLLISHTCQSRTEGQPKAQALARLSEIELRVLVPRFWKHYGSWRQAQPSDNPSFLLDIRKARWPWLGPAQYYLHFYPCLRKILKEFRPDVIDLWEEPWGLVSAHTCWLRNRLLQHTCIISETEQNIDKTLPFPFERFRRYTLQNADFAVGRNAQAVSVLRAKGFTGPAEVVPNAVDDGLFKPLERQTCRRALGLNGFVVGYFGRLVEEKGLDDLLDALALCPNDVQLLLVGSGPLQQGLVDRALQAGIGSRLHLLGTHPLERLPRLMNALDVLALPSRTTARWKEQFGRVVIEAHACGVPVIGSDSGAIPEVVGAGGMIVPERDPQALAGALRWLRADPDQRALLGRIGLQQVQAHYTWQRVAARMHAIYQRALAGGRVIGGVPDRARSVQGIG